MNIDDYYCSIYCNSFLDRDSFRLLLSDKLALSVKDGSLFSENITIFIVTNDEYDIEKAVKFPDGFLFYKFIFEVQPTDERVKEDIYIKDVGNILNKLWSENIPAIAACGFEDELPNKGGYKSPNTPVPSKADSEI